MANDIGWGSGAANNSIGWGQGKTNNTIDWGEIYDLSPSGETDLVGVIPPTSLTSPVVSGSGVVGQTLSTTDGTWSGTLPITFTYQWNRNGSIILGATNNTYTLVTADASTSIDCTVTATNAGGSLSKNSNAISVAAAGDADANAFIAAAAITDTTQKAAIDKLVVDLKGYGIWTKMKAIYPFCGGTAAQHKYNLKDPRDLDSAFRLVFNGGVTHNSNGITGNGVNSFAETFLNDSVTLNIDNKHIAMYQRNVLTSESGGSMGIGNSNRFYLNSGGSNYSTLGMVQTPFTIQAPQNGMFLMSKNAIGSFKYYQNALTPITKTGTNQAQNTTHYLLASHLVPGTPGYSSANLALASLGDGLSDTEVTNYRTAINTFQTTLSRNV